MHILKAAALYFALVLLVGWIFGPVREIVLAPRLGRTAAVLVEAPIMLLASYLAAHRIVPRAARSTGERAALGAIAFVFLIVAELAGNIAVRGIGVGDYIASLGTAQGAVSLALFIAFAGMPLVAGRAR